MCRQPQVWLLRKPACSSPMSPLGVAAEVFVQIHWECGATLFWGLGPRILDSESFVKEHGQEELGSCHAGGREKEPASFVKNSSTCTVENKPELWFLTGEIQTELPGPSSLGIHSDHSNHGVKITFLFQNSHDSETFPRITPHPV